MASPSASSSATSPTPTTTPRIIIHGGAGNITHDNLPVSSLTEYRRALLSILTSSARLFPSSDALTVAVHAVTMLENNPLFNAGRGAVFTRTGTIELEASVMVSNGYRKRGVGVMGLKRVKNPIRMAKEMLVRGERDDGGGAGKHCQLFGGVAERLAGEWGCEIVGPSYFWTRKRWEEHLRGLEREKEGKGREPVTVDDGESKMGGDMEGLKPSEEYAWPEGDPGWDGKEYLPQGTVGAVVMDRFGTVCVATSTGGLTNKLPGRIGDTPTLGAGFWAEEWFEEIDDSSSMIYRPQCQQVNISAPRNLASYLTEEIRTAALPIWRDCLASLLQLSQNHVYNRVPPRLDEKPKHHLEKRRRHAVALSGTGNGDSFLRTCAVRTAAASSRFSSPNKSLSESVTAVAGPFGELQQSAGEHWGVTGEGEGGLIGIEFAEDDNGKGKSSVVFDFNCGGMFRAWIDDDGMRQFSVFRD